MHTPEFEFEKDEDNVKNAVKRFNITYPVAMDNNYQIWQAYDNSYWPAHYLIDQNGIVREVHFGEGNYFETENAIRSLLKLPLLAKEKTEPEAPHMAGMTHETYLGYKRADTYTSAIHIENDKKVDYHYDGELKPNEVGLQGAWTVMDEQITSASNKSKLILNFKANHVYLVLGGSSQEPVRVLLDNKPLKKEEMTPDMNKKGEIFVKDPRKYDIIDLKGQPPTQREITIEIPEGIKAYAFTFG